jgi:hypothetical protein
MRRWTVLGVFLAAALFAAGFGLAGGSATVRLTARLDARHERPAPRLAAAGAGGFTATLDGRSLTWRLTFGSLTGKALAAHIHLGRPGVAGPVAVPLCGPCVSGAHGKLTITAHVRAVLLAGGAYVNVHTAKNAAGEIRGQVLGPKTITPPKPAASPTTTGGGYGY